MTVNLEELGQELGITPSGLRKRIHALGLEVERGSRGKWLIPEDLAAVLRDADKLLKDGAGATTVRRVLGITVAPSIPDCAASEDTDPGARTDRGGSAEGTEPDRPVAGDSPIPERAQAMPDVRELAGLVAAAVADAVKAENDLAEKYARAAHRIGELEATTRGLEADRDRLAGELAEAKAERDQARTLLAAPRRPWWKIWS